MTISQHQFFETFEGLFLSSSGEGDLINCLCALSRSKSDPSGVLVFIEAAVSLKHSSSDQFGPQPLEFGSGCIIYEETSSPGIH